MVPDAPHGWPSPMAPPSEQTMSGSSPRSSIDGQHHGREGLGDLDGTDVGQGDARGRGTAGAASSRRTAGAGPSPGRSGRPAATAAATIRRYGSPAASGRRPRCVTATAAAPSEMPQELPAVAVPSAPNDGSAAVPTAGVVMPGARPLVARNVMHRNDFRVVDTGL